MSVEALIDVINQFAVQQSNPVLAILPQDGKLEYDHKYPEPILNFAGDGVCAYYHCHSAANRPAAEHGHFHIFLHNETGQWSHLVALSVDAYGQPLQWFTVNNWVTGEAWGTSQALLSGLADLSSKPQHSMVEQWLLALLQFYRPLLADLLRQRDARLATLSAQQNIEEVKQDRDIYTLSSQDIRLLQDIEAALAVRNCENI